MIRKPNTLSPSGTREIWGLMETYPDSLLSLEAASRPTAILWRVRSGTRVWNYFRKGHSGDPNFLLGDSRIRFWTSLPAGRQARMTDSGQALRSFNRLGTQGEPEWLDITNYFPYMNRLQEIGPHITGTIRQTLFDPPSSEMVYALRAGNQIGCDRQGCAYEAHIARHTVTMEGTHVTEVLCERCGGLGNEWQN